MNLKPHGFDTKLRNKDATILNENFSELGKIKVDLQPKSSIYTYKEERYNIPLTHRIYCDINNDITLLSYLLIDDKKYKVIKITSYSDYLSLLCYQCEVI